MSCQPRGAVRPSIFVSVLVIAAGTAIPVSAQVETVVVTAQKRTEDVQTVPIAVTAFTDEDIKAQRINQARDLQFHAPNVTYTTSNYGNTTDFQIRGIGLTSVGYDDESGVAVDFDEVYLAAPQLTEGSFYDLSGIEILAGPQSTLYGRGATGGVVNINIAKPDLDTASVQGLVRYGNYDAFEFQGAANYPVVADQLALRVAGDYDSRSGFVTNIADDSHPDSLSQYSVRGTLRWAPTERSTIDITAQLTKEDDSHMRADKQLCTTDPTGVLGCLPNTAGSQPVNVLSNLPLILSSQQALSTYLGSAFFPVTHSFTVGEQLGTYLGLYNLGGPAALGPNFVEPSGARQINASFDPVWRSQDNFLSLKWQQNWTSWLDSTLIAGYDNEGWLSQESYNNIASQPFATSSAPFPANCIAALAGSANLNCAVAAFQQAASMLYGPAYVTHYAPYFSHPGELPLSKVGGFGLIGGNYGFTPANLATDQNDGRTDQYSGELRFATNFKGPLNAMLGFYYLHTSTAGDYYVLSPPIDYPAIVLGGLLGPAVNPSCMATGCILAPSYYHNFGEYDRLTSRAVFGEAYYDAIPDTLKFTAGLRFTDDHKTQADRIELVNAGFVPIGTTNDVAPVTQGFIAQHIAPFDDTDQRFDQWTGRVVADYTPKLAFTDQTLIYASYSRGYKAGGANPGIQAGNNPANLPLTYEPEFINDYELGTKNLLFGNTLQANGDFYYYDYANLQVSTIVNNTSVNDNINATAWGLEGNLLWQPAERWQFSLGVANENSGVDAALVDLRNPTGGDPHTLLLKDDSVGATTGGNCVVYYHGQFPALPFNTPIATPFGLATFTAPAAGIHALQGAGIANAAFGPCNAAGLYALRAYGFSASGPDGSGLLGQKENLNGNALQYAPQMSISLTAQYTQPLPQGYDLVARADARWQSHMWQRIWQDGADYIGSEYVVDASLELDSPDGLWYAQAFVKNLTNQNSITGGYLGAPASGLFTNVFYGDPRTYGIELGVHFQ